PHGRGRLRRLPPALLDQHLPRVEAGPALPHAGPQRRDQHASRQPELDARPRDPHGGLGLRRPRSGGQAGGPAGRFRLGGAGQCLRGLGPRRAPRPPGQGPAGPRSLVLGRR
ncbi:hypothetical protein LTR94_035407, partial [Friedmanniomyces endolithicus]